jgi:hypothetical protein
VLLHTKEKVCVSPLGWRTVFDFLSAKVIKINERGKKVLLKVYKQKQLKHLNVLEPLAETLLL